MVFAPGHELSDAYNMWRGFAVTPQPGEFHHSFLRHIADNVCGGNELAYDYVVKWMARAVQVPDQPGQTAIVLRGDQGVGKGIFAKSFGRLFGRHFAHVTNAQHLTGNFNAHLRDCCILFADEAFYAGDKRHASTLKTLVTEDSIMVEPKGVDTEMTGNCLHIIMASNEAWVVPAGMHERRFCVLDVSKDQMQNSSYFGQIHRDLRRGGFENLLHYLLHVDLTHWDVRKLPQTKALRDQKIQSFTPEQEWWYGKLMDGKLLTEHAGWEEEVLVEELKNDFIEYTRQFNMSRRGTATRLGHFLRRACPDEQLQRFQSSETVTIGDRTLQRPYFYTMPSLDECRSWWDKEFGGPYDWPKIEKAPEADVPF